MGTQLPHQKGGAAPQFSAHVYCGHTAAWIKMQLCTVVRLGPDDIVLDGDPGPPSPKGRSPPIFGPCLLRPNGCMDQDATWYGDRPQPRRLCVRWYPAPSPQKGGGALSPIFAPCLLWPNGWMDQDSTCHGGRPQSRRLCVRWEPSPLPQKGLSATHFSVHVYCGQTAAWIKMPLGTEVGLGVRNIVFDVDPATPRKRAHPCTQFWPLSIVAKWLDG